jgi:hypothetical protein
VEAGVDDAVHVEVEVVELEPVGVGVGGVHGHLDAVNLHALLLHHVHHHHRVLLRQPPVERRDPHHRGPGEERRGLGGTLTLEQRRTWERVEEACGMCGWMTAAAAGAGRADKEGGSVYSTVCAFAQISRRGGWWFYGLEP